MAKVKTQFICSSCGAVSERWQGKCAQCGEWNTLSETQISPRKKSAGNFGIASSKPELLKDSIFDNPDRMVTGISEFDRVVGDGIVPGSLILLGGDPGIGKSTLVMQVASGIAREKKVMYVSGEESVKQIGLRAGRLGVGSDNLFVLSETNVDTICEQIRKGFSLDSRLRGNDKEGETNVDMVCGQIREEKPAFVIIDSIQTMYCEDVVSASGSVGQVSVCAQKLMEVAKSEHIAIILIGHVTKEGNLAGPRLLEHLVDVVLYLEGNRYGGFRILRGIKNRFGSTNETGIFEMTGSGMEEVKNPSKVLLSERADSTSGTVVFPTMEGTRPLLIEIQALTSITNFGYPKRTASGMDLNRLNLLIAVLTKRAGLNLTNQDVYINVVGGMAIREPAMDLAAAISIASAYKNKAVKKDTVIFGEIGLAGEVRNVDNIVERLKEAEKLGFKTAILPASAKLEVKLNSIKPVKVSSVKEAIEEALGK